MGAGIYPFPSDDHKAAMDAIAGDLLRLVATQSLAALCLGYSVCKLSCIGIILALYFATHCSGHFVSK